MLDLGPFDAEPAALAAIVLSLGTALVSGLITSRGNLLLRERRAENEALGEVLLDLDRLQARDRGHHPFDAGHPFDVSWRAIVAEVRGLPGVGQDDLRRIEERIAAIEERFPDAATIDKVASVNDAILATRVETLEKEIADLKANALTEWKVAGVVFKILSVVAALVAVAVLFV